MSRSRGSLVFDPEKHRYTLDGKSLPGVTTMLKVAGFMGSGHDFVKPHYLTRGTRIHAATCMIDTCTLDRPYYLEHWPEEAGYLTAYDSFLAKVKPRVLARELRGVYQGMHPFAGTVDRVLKINGRWGVLDIKTGDPQPWHKLQLMAYRMFFRREMAMWSLQLKDDGKFKLDEHNKSKGEMLWSDKRVMTAASLAWVQIEDGLLEV